MDNSSGQGKTLPHSKMGFYVCSAFLTQQFSSSVPVPVPALPAGMGDTSTTVTDTFLQGEQGISHGDIPAVPWLVALQGISCGDMLGTLCLLPFQPLQSQPRLLLPPSALGAPGTQNSVTCCLTTPPGGHRSFFSRVCSALHSLGQFNLQPAADVALMELRETQTSAGTRISHGELSLPFKPLPFSGTMVISGVLG